MRRAHAWLLIAATFITALLLIGSRRLPTAVSSPLLQISPASGRYDQSLSVQIHASHPTGIIRYRLNNGEERWTYRRPIHISAVQPSVMVVEAQLYLADGTMIGEPLTAHYAVGWEDRLPVLSIAIEPTDFTGANGIYTHFEKKGPAWERPSELAYLPSGLPFVTKAGLRLHGNWTRTFYAKKSFRLYFRDDFGADGWDIFGDDGDRFVLHNSGQDLLVFKNSLMTSLAADLGLPAAQIEPILLFINGEPWGIYHVRERMDEGFLQRRYGQMPFDLLDTPDNPDQQRVVAGSRAGWDHLVVHVSATDLSQSNALAYIETQVNLDNLIDYTLLQLYAADRDWPEFNVNQFRPERPGGRWHWAFWDNDLSFEDAERPLFPFIFEPAAPTTALLLRSLLQNEAFRQRFLARADVLLQTTLSAEAMTLRVEALTAVYEADIELEKARWEIDRSWETRRQELLTFVQRRPEVMWEELTAVLDN